MDINKRFNQYDEMIAEMWKIIDRINADIDRRESAYRKQEKRVDLTIKRLVKLEALDNDRTRIQQEQQEWMRTHDNRTSEYSQRITEFEKQLNAVSKEQQRQRKLLVDILDKHSSDDDHLNK